MNIREHYKKGMDIIPPTEPEKNIREEVNKRTWKAGHTDRDGQPLVRKPTGAGKGDQYRPVNKKRYDENYKRIFGHS